jgi:hypothetical protein
VKHPAHDNHEWRQGRDPIARLPKVDHVIANEQPQCPRHVQSMAIRPRCLKARDVFSRSSSPFQ